MCGARESYGNISLTFPAIQKSLNWFVDRFMGRFVNWFGHCREFLLKKKMRRGFVKFVKKKYC